MWLFPKCNTEPNYSVSTCPFHTAAKFSSHSPFEHLIQFCTHLNIYGCGNQIHSKYQMSTFLVYSHNHIINMPRLGVTPVFVHNNLGDQLK